MSEIRMDDQPPDPQFAASLTQCWRCEQICVSTMPVCPACRAPLHSAADLAPSPAQGQRRGISDTNAVLLLVFAFFGLSITNIVLGWLYHFGIRSEDTVLPDFGSQVPILALLSIVDAVLTVGIYAIVRKKTRQPKSSISARLLAWVLAMPVLAALLALNVSLSSALRDYLGLEQIQVFDEWHEHWVWAVLLICFFPALFEELFFRQMVLGSLRRVMSVHGAVWVSSFMFGLAHIGNPLGMPYLIVCGAALAYLRVGSSGLLLPVAVHFLHNLAVILIAGT